MEIGSTLKLKQVETDYHCKIIEKDKDFLYIDYPYDIKSGKIAFLMIGTKLIASFIDKNKNVFQFNTEIKKYLQTKIPSIAIMLPDKDEIKRIQRREFVRISTVVDVTIKDKENSNTSFETVTVDISGGGAAILVPNNHTMNIDEEYSLIINLPMNNEKKHFVSVVGKVVRLTDKNDVHIASIDFQDISTSTEQKIIRFCFEKQREERQKELL